MWWTALNSSMTLTWGFQFSGESLSTASWVTEVYPRQKTTWGLGWKRKQSQAVRKAIPVLFSVLLLKTIELLFSFIFNSKFNKKNSKKAKLYWIYNIVSCSHWAKQHLQAQQTEPQGRHWLYLRQLTQTLGSVRLTSSPLGSWLLGSGVLVKESSHLSSSVSFLGGDLPWGCPWTKGKILHCAQGHCNVTQILIWHLVRTVTLNTNYCVTAVRFIHFFIPFYSFH